MDLSGLKWPIIILVVVGIGWLLSSGGVEYMVNSFTKATPGQDVERDRIDEAGLSRVGGYLLFMWRYERAMQVLQTAVGRYGPAGANYWFNLYRIALCLDRLGRYQESHNVYQQVIAATGSQHDNRVPNNDALRLKAAKQKEMHEF